MKTKRMRYALALMLAAINGAQAQAPAGNAVPVTVDNFVRAESDLYFAGIVKEAAPSGNLSIAANRLRSTSKPSSVSIATRFIRRPSSISMPDR